MGEREGYGQNIDSEAGQWLENHESSAQSAGRRRWAMQATAHVPARAETRRMVHLLTWRMGRKGGVGWVGMDGWIGTVFGDFMD